MSNEETADIVNVVEKSQVEELEHASEQEVTGMDTLAQSLIEVFSSE